MKWRDEKMLFTLLLNLLLPCDRLESEENTKI